MHFESSGSNNTSSQVNVTPYVPTPQAIEKKKKEKINSAAATEAGLNVAFYIDPDEMAKLPLKAVTIPSMNIVGFKEQLSQERDKLLEDVALPVACDEPITGDETEVAIKVSKSLTLATLDAIISGQHAAVMLKIRFVDECMKLLEENRKILSGINTYLQGTSADFLDAENTAIGMMQNIFSGFDLG